MNGCTDNVPSVQELFGYEVEMMQMCTLPSKANFSTVCWRLWPSWRLHVSMFPYLVFIYVVNSLELHD